VLIDAPCTGTGTWRRNPDAKWRMRPGALEIRMRDQVEVLKRAAALIKRTGRIAYVTCSVLQEENSDQISAFIARHNDFAVVPPAEVASKLGPSAKAFCDSVKLFDEGLLMTPHRTQTDGFFVAVLKRPH
jgi:16S rRNA (cytosine967-C5)-methyltransferase